MCRTPWWLFPEIMTHKTGWWFRKHGVFWLQNVNKKLYESKQKVLCFRWGISDVLFTIENKKIDAVFMRNVLVLFNDFDVRSFVRYAFSWPCINNERMKADGHRMEVWKFLPSDLKWVKWFDWLLWCARICFIGCRQPTSFHLNLTATSKITKLSALLCSVFYYMQSVTPAKNFDVVYIA